MGLAKVCKRHNIPKPPLGYWARVAHGKSPKRTPLPPAGTPEREQVSFEGGGPRRNGGGGEDWPSVPVVAKVTSPHPAIGNASEIGRSGYSRDEGLMRTCHGRANIAVAPQNVRRALRIMDAFLKAVEAKGCRVAPRGTYAHADMVIHSPTGQYPFKLRERKKRYEPPLTAEQQDHLKRFGHLYGRYKCKPTGRLSLTIGEDYLDPIVVSESARKKLEDRLGEAVGRLFERIAEEEEDAREGAAEAAEEARVMQEEQKRKEEAERIRLEEERRVNQMQRELSGWRLANEIRNYTHTIRVAMRDHGAEAVEGGSLDRWLQWLDGHAKKVDPLTALYEDLKALFARAKADSAARETYGDPGDDGSGHA